MGRFAAKVDTVQSVTLELFNGSSFNTQENKIKPGQHSLLPWKH